MSDDWVDRLNDLVRSGEWITYSTMSEVVYGHPMGRQSIGSALRATQAADSAHRVLGQGGTVSKHWKGVDLHGLGGGREECIARLRDEGSWDDGRDRARADRELDAETVRRRLQARPTSISTHPPERSSRSPGHDHHRSREERTTVSGRTRRKYRDIDMPDQFVLECLTDTGAWIDWGIYRADGFARGEDGTYLYSGDGSPLYLRCRRQDGCVIYVDDGAGDPYTYRLVTYPGGRHS